MLQNNTDLQNAFRTECSDGKYSAFFHSSYKERASSFDFNKMTFYK